MEFRRTIMVAMLLLDLSRICHWEDVSINEVDCRSYYAGKLVLFKGP